MKLPATLLAAALSLIPVSLWAEDDPVVVELFTSQGCSSCPPADRLLKRLTERGDVIALALHVDYWDYIGWVDEFADPAFTKRQKRYAKAAGRHMIYTPQMIVNGLDDLVGAHDLKLTDLIAAHKEKPARARVRLAENDTELTITIAAHKEKPARARVSLAENDTELTITIAPLSGPLKGPFDVHLVTYEPEQTVKIKKGENAGLSLDYVNVVTSWTQVGTWDGQGETVMETDLGGPLPTVVMVQETGPGEILAAAVAD